MKNDGVIIIKLKAGCEPIKYFEDSYIERKSNWPANKYYNVINPQDINYLTKHLEENQSYFLFAVVYDNKNKIIQAFLGNGEFIVNDKGCSFRLYIKVKSDYNNSIQNIYNLTELNFDSDFTEAEYVSVEKSRIIADQINYIITPPVLRKPNKCTYSELDSEKELHKLAQRNEYCRRMYNYRDPMPHRSEFQRDYERIVHSKSFRRMVDKAQIFSTAKGDYYRTRMTHSQAVDQIARGIAVGLKLNTNLTEAIALGHDIGHTPFGHQGERTLDDILHGKYDIIVDCKEYEKYNDTKFFGGFKHNYQSLRVASLLEEEYFEIYGMDLSYQTLEGMLKHTKIKRDEYDLSQFIKGDKISDELRFDSDVCSTLEGQVVAIADEIAQRGHDLDDALSSKAITYDELKSYLSLRKMDKANEIIKKIDDVIESAGDSGHRIFDESELKNSRIVSAVLSFFINDVIDNSGVLIDKYDENEFKNDEYAVKETLIKFSDEAEKVNNYLETIISSKVINNSEVSLFDSNAAIMVKSLFKAYYNNPRLLHKTTLRRLYISLRESSENVVDFEFGNYKVINDELEKISKWKLVDFKDENEREEYKTKRWILVRTICDYISGMTDTYAINEYNKLAKEF